MGFEQSTFGAFGGGVATGGLERGPWALKATGGSAVTVTDGAEGAAGRGVEGSVRVLASAVAFGGAPGSEVLGPPVAPKRRLAPNPHKSATGKNANGHLGVRDARLVAVAVIGGTSMAASGATTGTAAVALSSGAGRGGGASDRVDWSLRMASSRF